MAIYAFFYVPPEDEPEEPVVPAIKDTEAKVIDWRRHQLKKAGYEGVQITMLAERLDIDLHKACKLLEQGCPPALAVLTLV